MFAKRRQMLGMMILLGLLYLTPAPPDSLMFAALTIGKKRPKTEDR